MQSSFSLDIVSESNDAMTHRVTRKARKKGFAVGSFQAMGSPCELLVDTIDLDKLETMLEPVAEEAWRIEDKFSRYKFGNIVQQINDSDGRMIEVDDETARLLNFAATLTELSDGRFDITSGALRKVWTFDGSDNVPDSDSIRAVLKDVGWHKVSWNPPNLTLEPSMQIDFGGIGKEYAVDKAVELLEKRFENAFLVNFGGDIAARGAPSGSPGWQVGIESVDPVSTRSSRSIHLAQGGLATSGDARRFLRKNGIRYGHILDPISGWPVADAPRSITVAADSCTQAGMLATLAMLNGANAERFLQSQKVQFWACR